MAFVCGTLWGFLGPQTGLHQTHPPMNPCDHCRERARTRAPPRESVPPPDSHRMHHTRSCILNPCVECAHCPRGCPGELRDRRPCARNPSPILALTRRPPRPTQNQPNPGPSPWHPNPDPLTLTSHTRSATAGLLRMLGWDVNGWGRTAPPPFVLPLPPPPPAAPPLLAAPLRVSWARCLLRVHVPPLPHRRYLTSSCPLS